MSVVANAKNNKMPLWTTVLSEANQANTQSINQSTLFNVEVKSTTIRVIMLYSLLIRED